MMRSPGQKRARSKVRREQQMQHAQRELRVPTSGPDVLVAQRRAFAGRAPLPEKRMLARGLFSGRDAGKLVGPLDFDAWLLWSRAGAPKVGEGVRDALG